MSQFANIRAIPNIPSELSNLIDRAAESLEEARRRSTQPNEERASRGFRERARDSIIDAGTALSRGGATNWMIRARLAFAVDLLRLDFGDLARSNVLLASELARELRNGLVAVESRTLFVLHCPTAFDDIRRDVALEGVKILDEMTKLDRETPKTQGMWSMPLGKRVEVPTGSMRYTYSQDDREGIFFHYLARVGGLEWTRPEVQYSSSLLMSWPKDVTSELIHKVERLLGLI